MAGTSLLHNAGTSEPNYPNRLDECTTEEASTQFAIYSLSAYDTDGDSKLETGDTVVVSWEGDCIDGDPLAMWLAYSLNPQLGNSATWTNFALAEDSDHEECDDGTNYFNASKSIALSSTSSRDFTITGTPTYVAVRMIVRNDHDYPSMSNSCPSEFANLDIDDLVLKMYAPTPPSITSTNAINIHKTNATLTSAFTRGDATWTNTYWVVNGVNQTKSNSTSATGHNRTYTGLAMETQYNYKLCLYSNLNPTPICSSLKYFNTSDKTHPYINIASDFGIGITTASVGGTFFFMDFTNITAYVKLNGVNQTKTLYASGTSQYHHQDFTGLNDNTNYTWDFCISFSQGIICDGGGVFATLPYTPPYINAISTFNITNHEARVGATIFYGSYLNLTLEYYLDGVRVSDDDYNYNGSPSKYYTDYWTGLDYKTLYTYRLDVSYIDPNGLGAGNTWLDGYRINGTTTQLTYSDGRFTPDTNWTAQDDKEIISKPECRDLCNRYYGDPSLNRGHITEGNGTCWYIDNNPYDECFIGHDGSFAWYNAGTEGDWYTQYMNQSSQVTRLITGTTKNFTTLNPYPPYLTISGATDIKGKSATLTGTYYPYDYNSTAPYFLLEGVRINATPVTNGSYSVPEQPTILLTGLLMNTTYNYSLCVEYGTNHSIICDVTRNFTTTFEPSFTWDKVDITMPTELIWYWTIDYDNVNLVEYRFNGTGTWLVAPDGVQKNQGFTGLTPQTNYTAYVAMRYKVLVGSPYIYANSSFNTAKTYYENAFDDIWDTLLQGSTIGKLLLGFVVLFGILFLGISQFGKHNLQVGVLPILLMIVVGTAIATLMKLFTVWILILVIIGSVILMVLTNNKEGQ
jgi:hypothetical protein